MNLLFVHGGSWYDAKGGAEKQIELIKSVCVDYKHKVTHISINSLNKKLLFLTKLDNGSLYSLHEKNYFKRYVSVYKIIKNLKPNIIYTRSFRHIIFLYFCKKIFNIPIIYNISYDPHCIPLTQRIEYNIKVNFINIYSYIQIISHCLLKKLDLVIVQNQSQKELLYRYFQVKSILIPNGHQIPDIPIIKSDPLIISWIANFAERKQPEVFIKTAKHFEEFNTKFIMAGRPASSIEYQKKIVKQIEDVSNIKYIGELTFEETNILLSKSSIFVNTSIAEGFPNTFIQSWLLETPVVSLKSDPSNLLKKKKIGFHSKTYNQLINDIKFLLENGEERHTMGRRAKDYAIMNHEINFIGKKYIEIFRKVSENTGSNKVTP